MIEAVSEKREKKDGRDKKNKVTRKIFQPDPYVGLLLEEACSRGRQNISDFINNAVKQYFSPKTPALNREVGFLAQKVLNHEEVSEDELKGVLVRSVEALKDYPIENKRPLEQIFMHFTNRKRRALRYDYITVVDGQQDDALHRLNEILKTIDITYVLGTRQLGERSYSIFEHWIKVCEYSEIYTELSTLIECEKVYYGLTIYEVVDLVRQLDDAIKRSPLKPITTPFPTKITDKDRYESICYEVRTYYSEHGYASLTGDTYLENMPDDVKEYIKELWDIKKPDDMTDGDIEKISEIEQKGRRLFTKVIAHHEEELKEAMLNDED